MTRMMLLEPSGVCRGAVSANTRASRVAWNVEEGEGVDGHADVVELGGEEGDVPGEVALIVAVAPGEGIFAGPGGDELAQVLKGGVGGGLPGLGLAEDFAQEVDEAGGVALGFDPSHGEAAPCEGLEGDV